jgi:hypothetical protein
VFAVARRRRIINPFARRIVRSTRASNHPYSASATACWHPTMRAALGTVDGAASLPDHRLTAPI